MILLAKLINNFKNLIKLAIKKYRLSKLNKEYLNLTNEIIKLKLDAYMVRSQINDITGDPKSGCINN